MVTRVLNLKIGFYSRCKRDLFLSNAAVKATFKIVTVTKNVIVHHISVAHTCKVTLFFAT